MPTTKPTKDQIPSNHKYCPHCETVLHNRHFRTTAEGKPVTYCKKCERLKQNEHLAKKREGTLKTCTSCNQPKPRSEYENVSDRACSICKQLKVAKLVEECSLDDLTDIDNCVDGTTVTDYKDLPEVFQEYVRSSISKRARWVDPLEAQYKAESARIKALKEDAVESGDQLTQAQTTAVDSRGFGIEGIRKFRNGFKKVMEDPEYCNHLAERYFKEHKSQLADKYDLRFTANNMTGDGKLIVRCVEHNVWFLTTEHYLIQGVGCPRCIAEEKKSYQLLLARLRQVFKVTRVVDIVEKAIDKGCYIPAEMLGQRNRKVLDLIAGWVEDVMPAKMLPTYLELATRVEKASKGGYYLVFSDNTNLTHRVKGSSKVVLVDSETKRYEKVSVNDVLGRFNRV